MRNSLCHSRKALPAWTPNRHCERLKGAWQSQDYSTRLLRQNFQFFLAMTDKQVHATMPAPNND
ncbi:MAG: hypothetical protein ACEY3D_07400 [Rickettsia sp.]|uniref:hypothetical protein n=1 Tax=Rickettsia sp. TaxID=789 RepID=UPI00397D82B2